MHSTFIFLMFSKYSHVILLEISIHCCHIIAHDEFRHVLAWLTLPLAQDVKITRWVNTKENEKKF